MVDAAYKLRLAMNRITELPADDARKKQAEKFLEAHPELKAGKWFPESKK